MRAGALALLLAAALAGCSGEPPAPDEPSPSQTQQEETPTPPPLPEPGPLEVYLGYNEEPRTAEEWVLQIARRENATAACMAEQGFDYIPQVPDVDRIEYLEGPAQGSRAFIEQWGYGVWSSPPGGGGGGLFYPGSGVVDPNMERRQTMSEAEGEAYDTALAGPVTEVHEDGSITRSGGCLGAEDDPVGPDVAYLLGVRDDAQAFLRALGGDSRFADVDAAWASCMADAGFDFANPAAAQQQVWDELTAETADGSYPTGAEAANLAEEEVRVAVADLDCQEATDWPARHRAIEIQLQQEYVDAHLADLEALAAAVTPAPTAD